MKFRTELHLSPSPISITYKDKLVLIGSCFSENIGSKLKQAKYTTCINPIGIIYHPIPLHNTIIDALAGKEMQIDDLNKNNDGQYTAWNMHSRLCDVEADKTLNQMNEGITQLRDAIQEADYLILTYGTSYYYNHKEFGVVANCHKFPSVDFEKKLSSPKDITQHFDKLYKAIKDTNPTLDILLTVSPVRHIKDGIIKNNRSKSHLLTAVHDICDLYEHCLYLPSYELQMDDLRDYRYYADDMVHPSSQAVNYIWSKISEYILDPSESSIRSDISKLVQAAKHRPFM